jgi:hypothetical protein
MARRHAVPNARLQRASIPGHQARPTIVDIHAANVHSASEKNFVLQSDGIHRRDTENAEKKKKRDSPQRRRERRENNANFP